RRNARLVMRSRFSSLPWLRAQARQSSTSRATSAHGGRTSEATPALLTATLPRLNTIASRMGSVAAISPVASAVAGSNEAGMLRLIELVQIVRFGTAPVTALAMATFRVAREQRTANWTRLDESAKRASLPFATGPYDQFPGTGVATLRSPG